MPRQSNVGDGQRAIFGIGASVHWPRLCWCRKYGSYVLTSPQTINEIKYFEQPSCGRENLLPRRAEQAGMDTGCKLAARERQHCVEPASTAIRCQVQNVDSLVFFLRGRALRETPWLALAGDIVYNLQARQCGHRDAGKSGGAQEEFGI